MRMTHGVTIGFGIVALILGALLVWVFEDGMFALGDSFAYQRDPKDGFLNIFDGTWTTYFMFAAIIAATISQVSQLPEGGIQLSADVEADTPGNVRDPKSVRLLFNNSFWAILWIPIRLYVGFRWMSAGTHKVFGDGWMDGGSALQGYLTGATTINPETGTSRAMGTASWYHDFLVYIIDKEWYTWFAKVVAVGELLVGIGLLVGGLVGLAAFFGMIMNANFMFAGTTSSNPYLLVLTGLLFMGWKVAGFWGLDRWLLQYLSTPWDYLSRRRASHQTRLNPDAAR